MFTNVWRKVSALQGIGSFVYVTPCGVYCTEHKVASQKIKKKVKTKFEGLDSLTDGGQVCYLRFSFDSLPNLGLQREFLVAGS